MAKLFKGGTPEMTFGQTILKPQGGNVGGPDNAPPTPPKPPEPVAPDNSPTTTDSATAAAASAAADRAAEEARRRRGYGSTILTSGEGVLGSAPVTRRTLLGGA